MSRSHYTGPDEDAGCENSVAYGYFICPMFFNYFTGGILLSIDLHFKKTTALGLSLASSYNHDADILA